MLCGVVVVSTSQATSEASLSPICRIPLWDGFELLLRRDPFGFSCVGVFQSSLQFACSSECANC